jgi:hypothetical protein
MRRKSSPLSANTPRQNTSPKRPQRPIRKRAEQYWFNSHFSRFSPFFVVHTPLGPRFRGDDKQWICLGILKILFGNGSNCANREIGGPGEPLSSPEKGCFMEGGPPRPPERKAERQASTVVFGMKIKNFCILGPISSVCSVFSAGFPSRVENKSSERRISVDIFSFCFLF